MMTLKPQNVHFAEGSIGQLGSILAATNAQSPFFAFDQAAYASSVAAGTIEPLLTGRETLRFSGFEPNPKEADVERGMKLFRSADPDIVIAFGGGTCLDLAKLIANGAVNELSARDIITGSSSFLRQGPPIVAVPTTAGTGSEATHFSVAYVDGKKYSVAHPYLLPSYVILDPQITYGLPAEVTAASGLDALCQAIESIWSVGATSESIEYAAKAIQLCLPHLEAAVLAPSVADRRGMMEAAHLAGKAINITKTTAPHAISYSITSHFGVPHGKAVAITLAPMLRYNAAVSVSDCNDPRGVVEVKKRIDLLLDLLGGSVANSVMTIEDIIRRVGGVIRLSEIGADNDDAVKLFASQVNPERLSNNPRQMDSGAIKRLLQSVR